jgi:hypothetical protein
VLPPEPGQVLALLGDADYAVAGAGLDQAALRPDQDVLRAGGALRSEPQRYSAVLRVGDGKVGIRVSQTKVSEQRCSVLSGPYRPERA